MQWYLEVRHPVDIPDSVVLEADRVCEVVDATAGHRQGVERGIRIEMMTVGL